MMKQRVLGLVLILGGLLACLSGADSLVQAKECILSEEIYPATCIPSQQWAPHFFPGEGEITEKCVNWYSLWCWPDPVIGCWTEGYGAAANGRCNHELWEAQSGICFEGAFEETVTIYYHRQECRFHEGICQCVWILGEKPSLYVETCNCVYIP